MRLTLIATLTALQAWGSPQLSEARRAELAGDLAAAEKAYQQELQARPAAETWQRLGLVRHLRNRFEQAIPAFQEALRLDPSLWTSHLFLGIAQYRTNRFPAALSSLEQARRLAPGNHAGAEELDFWLGAAYIAVDRPLSGARSLEKLLARNPQHVEALALAVQTYADFGAALWNGVAERHFETAAGYEVHGNALESESDLPGALEAYRRSIALDSGRPGPRLASGRILLRNGKYQEALAILLEELKVSPGDPNASHYAALAAIPLGRLAEAIRWLETAAQWPRRNPDASLALAQLYLGAGDNEKALAAAQRAAAYDPSSPAAQELVSEALERTRRQ